MNIFVALGLKKENRGRVCIVWDVSVKYGFDIDYHIEKLIAAMVVKEGMTLTANSNGSQRGLELN